MVKIAKRGKGKVPLGRTLSTYDHYLNKNSKSNKERPVAVIERNRRNELAVVPLSSRDGKHRTQLKNYQDGRSYFKHFVETCDNEGQPIKVGTKFRENHPRNDISGNDVKRIRHTIFKSSKPAPENRKKIEKFRQ